MPGMVASQILEEYNILLENTMNFNLDYNYTGEPDMNFTYDNYMCAEVDTSSTYHFKKLLMSCAYPLIFLLGSTGNLLVIVILWRYRHSRTSTEQFLFHLALANLLLISTFPFGIAEIFSGWVFGTFLCKMISAINKINFYSSSLLLGCISIDRYLAVVHALQTFQKPRALSVHLMCLAVWLLSILLVLPDLLFTEVWTGNDSFKLCHFREFGAHGINSWLVTRFLYHIVGFFLPSVVMCYCYAAIIRALCRSRRLQRHKAVKVAILVTSVFLVCWTPYHVVTFLDTLRRLDTSTKRCAVADSLGTGIVLGEVLAYSHCCLNPFLYAFVGIRFRHDVCRILHDLGCLSQSSLQEILGTGRTDSSTETNVSIIRPFAAPYSANSCGSPAPFFSSPALTDQMASKEGMGLILEQVPHLKTGGADLQ